MTSLANFVLLIYGVLMLVGGFIGYRAAGSRASLIAGLVSGFALLGTWAWARSTRTGFVTGAVIALLLCVAFAMRFAKTGNFMPSGMLLLVSILSLLIFAIAAFRGV